MSCQRAEQGEFAENLTIAKARCLIEGLEDWLKEGCEYFFAFGAFDASYKESGIWRCHVWERSSQKVPRKSLTV